MFIDVRRKPENWENSVLSVFQISNLPGIPYEDTTWLPVMCAIDIRKSYESRKSLDLPVVCVCSPPTNAGKLGKLDSVVVSTAWATLRTSYYKPRTFHIDCMRSNYVNDLTCVMMLSTSTNACFTDVLKTKRGGFRGHPYTPICHNFQKSRSDSLWGMWLITR